MKVRQRVWNRRRRRSKKRKSSKKRRRRNYQHKKGGELVTMANRKRNRRKRRRRNVRRSYARAANPRRRRRHSYRRRRRNYRRSRNPANFGAVGSAFKDGAWAITGGIGTKALTAGVLPMLRLPDAGVTGWIGNGVSAFLLSMIARRWFGVAAGKMVFIGGMVQTVGRVASETIGAQLVQFGGIPGLSGQFVPQSFPVPYSSLPDVQRALPPAEVAAAASAAPAMSGPWAGGPWN